MQVKNIFIGGALVPLELKSLKWRELFVWVHMTQKVSPQLRVENSNSSRSQCPSLAMWPSIWYGKSSSTINTSKITASLKDPSLSLNMNANPKRHSASCRWQAIHILKMVFSDVAGKYLQKSTLRWHSTSFHQGAPHHCSFPSNANVLLTSIILKV